MASIFDQARNVLKNLQGGATNVVNSFNFDPTSNNGKNFWSTPVAQGLGQAQRFLESPKSINIPQAPRQLNPTINVGFKNTPFQVPIQPVQMARDFVNTPVSYTANTLSDIGVNAGRLLRGEDQLKYNQVKSPVTRFGMNVGSIFNPGHANELGVSNTPQQLLGNVAGTVEGPLSIYGGGKVLGLGKVGETALNLGPKQVILQGIKSGAGYGATYGVLDALANGREKSIPQDIKDAFMQGVGGAVVGGLLGGSISSLGTLKGLLTRKPQVEAQLRDLQGRWVAGEAPIKPNGMPKAQWDFQLNFNSKYKRNPYSPVYTSDVAKAIQYETEKRGAGLSIRDVNKDINPLGDKTSQSLEGIKGDVMGKVTQTSKQVEPKPTPLDRTPEQVKMSQEASLSTSPQDSLSQAGGVSNPGGKALSNVSVPDSSKYSYNINKNKLQMTESQKQTLDTVVTTAKPALEKLKGKTLTNAEVVKAAKTSDMLTQVTAREQTMQAEAAILKARQRVVELNKNIDRLAKEGNTTEMKAQMKDLVESLRVVSSTAADTGRKLQSFNINAGDESLRTQVLKEIGKTDAKTSEILKAADGVDWNNVDSITKFYRKFVKPSFMDVLDEYRYNNMLSNPKTHIRNAFSNLNQTFITRPMTLVVEGKPVEAAKYFTGSVKSLPEAMQAFTDSFKGKTAIGKPDMNQIGTGKLPKFLTVPTRAMEAGDQFFTALIKGGEQARGATAEQAAKTAEYSLFRQGLNPKGQGSVLNAVDSLTNWTYKAPKAVRWFVPFIRTPMNFAKQWIEYSPAGFATAYKAGAPREQIAKAVLGSTVAAFGGVLAMQGKTTWAAPTDPKQKDLFYASGRKPFSILVGDKWVPMQYAGPFALALALPAAMKFYQEDNRTAPTDSQIDKAVKVVSASAQFFSQQTFLSGLGNFVNWASGNQDVTLGSSLGFTAQQIIPMEALISYVNSIIDPVYRKAPGFIPSIQKNIPGLSQQLPAYTDPNGEPSKRIPSNYVAPYDLGQQQKQYEPALQIRGEKLQNNAIFNKAIKPYTELDGQIKDLVKAGQTEKAKALILQNKDILIKGEEIKKFKSQFDEYYSDLDKVSASNQLTPEQKQQIITIIKQRIDLLNKAYSTFQSQGYQQ